MANHHHPNLTSKVSFEVGLPDSPTKSPSPNSASFSSRSDSLDWNENENDVTPSAAERLKADIKAQTGSQSSLDSAMGALSLMSSHHSLASLGDKEVPLESKVLVIYVGGTIGMKKNKQGGLYGFLSILKLHLVCPSKYRFNLNTFAKVDC